MLLQLVALLGGVAHSRATLVQAACWDNTPQLCIAVFQGQQLAMD